MDYPSNSRMKKDAPEPEPKKIERVVTGEVVRKRKSLGKRLTETFIGGDAHSVWQYVTFDVMIPAAKDMVSDAVSQGVERMLFGDSARSTSRRRASSGGSGPMINYSRYSSGQKPREEPRSISRRGRANHDFNEIILETRAEAEEVIGALGDLIERYKTATVSDLYELVGVTGDFTDEKYGWTDIRAAGVSRVRQGYLLDLPRPELLD